MPRRRPRLTRPCPARIAFRGWCSASLVVAITCLVALAVGAGEASAKPVSTKIQVSSQVSVSGLVTISGRVDRAVVRRVLKGSGTRVRIQQRVGTRWLARGRPASIAPRSGAFRLRWRATSSAPVLRVRVALYVGRRQRLVGRTLILTVSRRASTPTAAGELATPTGAPVPGQLASGGSLGPGQTLASPDGGYRLVMQPSGTLALQQVEDGGARTIWSAAADGRPGSRAIMQADGDLAVYDAGGARRYSSQTAGNPGASLNLHDDGRLALFRGFEQVALLATPPATLAPGGVIGPGGGLTSPNGRFRAIMQGDGNLVVYEGAQARWNSRTAGHHGARLAMQGDGNLVIYKGAQAVWNSRTAGHPGASLALGADGHLVVGRAGQADWSSRDSLEPGSGLDPGGALSSPSAQYRAIMQGDGNLVVYDGHQAIWNSQTAGRPGGRLVMQGDGNLVVYVGAEAVWNSQTAGQPGGRLVMQDDGNLVIYRASSPVWASRGIQAPPPAAPPRELGAGGTLGPGASLTSTNGRYRLVMQGDGNLVAYDGSRALWNAGTAGNPGARAILQGDGNFVVYQGGQALWNSQTTGQSVVLIMQDDGNAVIYAPGAQALWSSLGASSASSVAEAAARWAEARVGQVYTSENPNAGWWSGWCETFVSLAYGRRFRNATAYDHYLTRRNAGQIRGGVPPRGALVFWDIGGAGHVAIAVGGGQVVGTRGYETQRLPVARQDYRSFPGYLGWAAPY